MQVKSSIRSRASSAMSVANLGLLVVAKCGVKDNFSRAEYRKYAGKVKSFVGTDLQNAKISEKNFGIS
ncbi:hypothetical protein [Candidatus Endomicrobiellum agilis]|uniref:hypothetical protein n=1 Tax=Candidatus Endomicrobiellum agilis TaxID=3238957 RepID=UPI00357DDED9|nr:hypothetical protein [Endomicrobium sp.]